MCLVSTLLSLGTIRTGASSPRCSRQCESAFDQPVWLVNFRYSKDHKMSCAHCSLATSNRNAELSAVIPTGGDLQCSSTRIGLQSRAAPATVAKITVSVVHALRNVTVEYLCLTTPCLDAPLLDYCFRSLST